jgi:uncharacterized protein (DUF2147 family)
MLAVFLASLLAASAPAPSGIGGEWLTANGRAIVTIRPCGRLMCGYITRVLNRGPGVPGVDRRNPDPAARSRPILGLPILTGFSGGGGAWRNGRAYDPETGRSYRASLDLDADGSLKVTGCVLFICRTQRWRRLR